MRSHILPSIIVVTSTLLLSVTAQSCYYPSGKSADGLIICKPKASVSHCCKDSDACLTNGLCFSPGLGAVLIRGCTDKTWKSSECLDLCKAGNHPDYEMFLGLAKHADILLCAEEFRSADAVL